MLIPGDFIAFRPNFDGEERRSICRCGEENGEDDEAAILGIALLSFL
jgi:hypothetical protein